MNHLSELRKRLQEAESAYVSAKTSLDNSLEYIVCKEELKQARFLFDRACRRYTLEHFFGEVQLDEQD